ncbi:50S ribosomal protein L9 [Ditylenchus destructor]|nr:50S ribosomal protein L9 [Ditylenchus destructor]
MPPPRGKGRFSKDRKPKRNQTIAAVPPQAFLPLHRRRGRADRLQGRRCPARLHQRKRQDRARPPDRHARLLPASAVGVHPMQVILLEKVANLGNLGDVVKVKDGYARNFLIPTRQARRATESAIKEFEAKRAELEKVAAEKLAAAQALGEKINGNTVVITQKAGVDGRLFGSVTNADIAEGLKKAGFEGIEKAQVRLPNGQLKAVGEFPINVAPHTDVVVEVTIKRDREAARSASLGGSRAQRAGRLLIDNTAWDKAADTLSDSDFYRYEHKQIYAAIGKLSTPEASRRGHRLRRADFAGQGRGMRRAGLPHQLAQGVPSAANLRRYAEIVRERAILRKLVATSDEIAPRR